ncbi:MAG: hypothetical protein ACLUQ6_02035 [Alistipes onderdonkii]
MEPTFVRKPLLAVKSNLLFDLASALNVELEVPMMGKRWSCLPGSGCSRGGGATSPDTDDAASGRTWRK